MAKQCPREADAFLFAVGELGVLLSLRVLVHLALCSACRASARRLRGTSKEVATAFGVKAAPFPLKVWALKGAWLALCVIGSAGLYVAGQRAVTAALATLDRPQIRQATFSQDDESRQRERSKRQEQ